MDHSEIGEDTLESEITSLLAGSFKGKLPQRSCQMCSEDYSPRSKYSRFCDDCKIKNEKYRFAEWLPFGVLN